MMYEDLAVKTVGLHLVITFISTSVVDFFKIGL